ncbi:hypothetical protein SAMN05216489_01870 [Streptomyces sp. 3213]|uniref:hypothetical protein n=1 Tax=Streptomyces sp. 3213.3 TaxID=1855348 RepID=UPI00089C96CE|nr:hypothetical protein [Streptomyces sp. 3213.3]SEC88235.1 hypothetical protein SAMN05216489_01870 [Streptomyces sp. 3213] [Streptomyces sp. 3213.3]
MSAETTQVTALLDQLAALAGQRGGDAQAVAELNNQLTPTLLRAEAVRLQLKIAELLDEADRLEFKAKLWEAEHELDGLYEVALQEESRLIKAVKAAIQAEREAEDGAREAAENHRLAVEAERAGHKLSATEQTDLLMRARAAADVAARFQASVEGARAHRESLEKTLAAARDDVRQREAANEVAHTLMTNPPKAPTSAATALLDGFRRLMWGQQLGKEATAVVTGLVQDAAKLTGVTRWTEVAAIEQHDKARANAAFERNMPAKGHPLRPSHPTSPVFAVRPANG